MNMELKKGEFITTKEELRDVADKCFCMGRDIQLFMNIAVDDAIKAYKAKLCGASLEEVWDRSANVINPVNSNNETKLGDRASCTMDCVVAGYNSRSETEADIEAKNICGIFFEKQRSIFLDSLD